MWVFSCARTEVSCAYFQDPVGAHFIESLKELENADIANSKSTGGGSVVERVSAVFQRREQEFLQLFTVR